MRKRERCSNFLPSEISKLINFVIKYKSAIEDKKMNGIIWRKKEKAWNKVTKEFNSTASYFRNQKMLRNKYDSLKRQLKVKMVQNKKAVYTGEEETPLTEWEKALLPFISLSVEESTYINDIESIKRYEDFLNLDDETVESDTSLKTSTEKLGYSQSSSVEGSISTNDCDTIKVEYEDSVDLNDSDPGPFEFDTNLKTITEKPGCSQSPDINIQDNEQSICEGKLSNKLMKQLIYASTKLTAESLNENDVLADSKKELLDLQIEGAKTELELKRKQMSYLEEDHQMKREIHLLTIQKLRNLNEF